MTKEDSGDDTSQKTPTTPATSKPKDKARPGPILTRAQIAAQKRVDKTVIKRMRKR
jgi:hypothetical protein